MTELGAVLEQLKQERKRAEGELRQLQKVIAALGKVTGRHGKRAKRRLSAAARARIAAAQRARWAKVRAKAAK